MNSTPPSHPAQSAKSVVAVKKRILVRDRTTASVASQPNPVRIAPYTRLVTTDGTGKHAFPIREDMKAVKIGRHTSSDYVIESDQVSLHHCQIYTLRGVDPPDGEAPLVALEDTSTNGTRWNGTLIVLDAVLLTHNDSINVGGQIFTFEQPESIDKATGQSKLKYEKIEHYKVSNRCIGEGATSQIMLAKNLTTRRQVVAKEVFHKAALVEKELEIISTLKHPNIINIEGFVGPSKPDGSSILFLQVVAGGDLFGFVRMHDDSGHSLKGAQVKWLAFQLARALDYLHREAKIAHRDIKPENILLVSQGQFPRLVLTDFGIARSLERPFKTLMGTMSYLPPEALTDSTGYLGGPADCWALGVILWILSDGGHPFRTALAFTHTPPEVYQMTDQGQKLWREASGYDQEVLVRVVRGGYSFRTHRRFGENDREAKEVFGRLLAGDASERCTAQGLLESDWIRTSRDQLEEMYRLRFER